ncbi:hypothetical protein [Scatolibacter rhodanostii]|uniref:hypothetical protein n=1 Tax=Scatolibacter rhodanostii TaxID=2014781 RepID=UPI000C0680E3|nr:hypothetical protein [Scatolibacter rhodanostii]
MDEEVESSLTFERLAEEYLNLCDKNCAGDETVGVFPCQFWKPPDVENGEPVPAYCALTEYLAENQQWGKN